MRLFTIAVLILTINIAFATLDQLELFEVNNYDESNPLNRDIEADASEVFEYDPPDVGDDQGYDPSTLSQILKAVSGMGKVVLASAYVPGTLMKLGINNAFSWGIGFLVWIIWIIGGVQFWRNMSGKGAM